MLGVFETVAAAGVCLWLVQMGRALFGPVPVPVALRVCSGRTKAGRRCRRRQIGAYCHQHAQSASRRCLPVVEASQ